MIAPRDLIRQNKRFAKLRWGSLLGRIALRALGNFTEQFQFSVSNGDLLFLDSGWYVTHSGLTGLARRNRCAGIKVQPVQPFCDPLAQRWAFEATVYKTRACKGFVGYGDANPSNVSSLVHGAEMRVAETRAVNRALRKAYGIGICSVEEIGSFAEPSRPSRSMGTTETTVDPRSATASATPNSIAAAPCSCWARLTRFWPGSSGKKQRGTLSSWH
jgi:hypothetical protein